MMHLTQILALLALSTAPAGAEELERISLDVDGRARTATLVRPAELADPPALVLVLHGVGGDAERIRGFTAGAFERVAREHGFLLAYPEAFEGVWNDCRATGDSAARAAGVDDVAFLVALVEHAREKAGGELAGVFAAGYSNGGQMCLRLAFEAPGRVDAVACFGALLPVPEDRLCSTAGSAVPTLLVAGTEDKICPFRGGPVRPPVGPTRGAVLSAMESASFLARRAGHGGAPSARELEDLDPGDGCRIEELSWRRAGRAEVTLLVVHGGGHALPLAEGDFPELVGRTSHDLDGAAELWRFFARQRSGR